MPTRRAQTATNRAAHRARLLSTFPFITRSGADACPIPPRDLYRRQRWPPLPPFAAMYSTPVQSLSSVPAFRVRIPVFIRRKSGGRWRQLTDAWIGAGRSPSDMKEHTLITVTDVNRVFQRFTRSWVGTVSPYIPPVDRLSLLLQMAVLRERADLCYPHVQYRSTGVLRNV